MWFGRLLVAFCVSNATIYEPYFWINFTPLAMGWLIHELKKNVGTHTLVKQYNNPGDRLEVTTELYTRLRKKHFNPWLSWPAVQFQHDTSGPSSPTAICPVHLYQHTEHLYLTGLVQMFPETRVRALELPTQVASCSQSRPKTALQLPVKKKREGKNICPEDCFF